MWRFQCQGVKMFIKSEYTDRQRGINYRKRSHARLIKEDTARGVKSKFSSSYIFSHKSDIFSRASFIPCSQYENKKHRNPFRFCLQVNKAPFVSLSRYFLKSQLAFLLLRLFYFIINTLSTIDLNVVTHKNIGNTYGEEQHNFIYVFSLLPLSVFSLPSLFRL